jgi:nicotinamide-nucleotide amidase
MVNDELRALATEVAAQFIIHKRVLTLAESCTGGLVSALLTDIAGSSAWFDSGFVVYSNQAKTEMLHVKNDKLDAFGAVSEEVAADMVVGALLQGRANIAASITGIAGPTCGTKQKPVGTVCFAWAGENRPLITTTKHFSGNRAQIRQHATKACLEGLLSLTINSDL